MSEHAPPAPPAFRYTLCATCTNEVRVDFYHEGPAQCEYCSGAVVPVHQQLREARRVTDRTDAGDNAAFLERVDNVLTRALPNPARSGALGRCRYCHVDYELRDGKVAHPGICVPKPRR